jgi:tryptophan-rich sensory protein
LSNLLAYVVIAVSVAAVATGGSALTQSGMAWYATLNLPAFTPAGGTIGMVWTVIYVLSAVAVMLLWRGRAQYPRFGLLVALLVLNGLLNVLWCYVFFVAHQLGLAVLEMIVLNLTTAAVIVLTWRRQLVVSLLLLPYFAWVCFATYLAASIWRMN